MDWGTSANRHNKAVVTATPCSRKSRCRINTTRYSAATSNAPRVPLYTIESTDKPADRTPRIRMRRLVPLFKSQIANGSVKRLIEAKPLGAPRPPPDQVPHIRLIPCWYTKLPPERKSRHDKSW